MPYSIPLGSADRLVKLYSYPNDPKDESTTLADTIQHWFDLTLVRDGFKAPGTTASVRVDGGEYFLDIERSLEVAGYVDRLPKFLTHGWEALGVIEQLKTAKKQWPAGLKRPTADKVWDPQNTDQWRFFLPLGMAMLRQRSLQFFHYPPIRLLTGMQDYLKDPVPVRWKELLAVNGVSKDQNPLFNVVVDGAPIAAPDDQGTQYIKKNGERETVHLIPISAFHDYQLGMVKLLLNTSSTSDAYTIPIVVYGTPARDQFSFDESHQNLDVVETYSALWGREKKQRSNTATTVEIIEGKRTAVAFVGHPYRFYAACQSKVGSGSILPDKCSQAVYIMRQDLTVARWQALMADDPAADPQSTLDDCKKYWNDSAQQATLCTLVQHQGSLYYEDPKSSDPKKALAFEFKLSIDQATDWCRQHANDPCSEDK